MHANFRDSNCEKKYASLNSESPKISRDVVTMKEND